MSVKRVRINETSPDMESSCKRKKYIDCSFDDGVGFLPTDTSPSTSEDEAPATNILSVEAAASFCFRSPEPVSPLAATPINYFTRLSDEVILHIFNFLPKKTLAGSVAYVCSRFRRLSADESLWVRMDCAGRVLRPGALGDVIARQVIVLRLSQAEIQEPAILPESRAAEPYFTTRLAYLDLTMTSISPTCLSNLLNCCRRLRKVSLEGYAHSLDTEILTSLSRNSDLEVLNLTLVAGVTRDGLATLFGGCRRLRELNIAWLQRPLSRECVSLIVNNLPRTVDRLNLAGLRKLLTDADVVTLCNSCPNLRELDLSDCTGLTGIAIQQGILNLQELNFLALSRCYLIPFQALLQLKQLTSLLYLDIHGGHVQNNEMIQLKETLGSQVSVNKFLFSSVARPTVGNRKFSIWNVKVTD